jgi:MFS family permease
MRAAVRFGPLEERDFRLLWLGQTTSAFGSALVTVALAFAVIDLTSSEAALGLVLAAGLCSRVVLLLLGGVLADRLPRQRVMLAADALRALTQGLVGVLLLSGQAQVWHLLVLFALFGAGDAFFSPASTGLVPETVSPGGCRRPMPDQPLAQRCQIAGPLLAGLIVAGVGPAAFAIDSGTFVLSTLSLVPAPPRHRRSSGGGSCRTTRGLARVTARTWVWTTSPASPSRTWRSRRSSCWSFVAERSLGGAAAWGLIGTCVGIGAVLGDAARALRPRRPLVAGGLLSRCGRSSPRCSPGPFRRRASPLLQHWASPGELLEHALVHGAPAADPARALSRVSSTTGLAHSYSSLPATLAGPTAATIGIPATSLPLQPSSACIGVADAGSTRPAGRETDAGVAKSPRSALSPRPAPFYERKRVVACGA